MTRIKREWCAMLAKLTAPVHAEAAVKAFIDMLPLLPQDDAAYNRDTLELAARRELGDPAIPNYDVLSRAFGKWHRGNRPIEHRQGADPVVQGITYALPDLRPPSPEECAEVAAKVAALKAEFGAKQGPRAAKEVLPKYLSKLELALSVPREVAMRRPDLAEALRQHDARA